MDVSTIHSLYVLERSFAVLKTLRQDLDALARSRRCFKPGDPQWMAIDRQISRTHLEWDRTFTEFWANASQASSLIHTAVEEHERQLAVAQRALDG